MKTITIVRTLALMALPAIAASQTSSPKQSGKPGAPVSGVTVDRAAAQAFENSLTSPVVPNLWPALPSVLAAWHEFPQAHYRIERAGQVGGPWVAMREVSGRVSDSIPMLPPGVQFYMRVLALRDGGKAGYVVADSTAPILVQTGRSKLTAETSPVPVLQCTAGPGNQVTFKWHRVVGFGTYLMTPYAVPSSGSGNVVTMAVQPMQAAIVVHDSTLTYTLPTNGRIVLRFQAQADFRNWPGPGQTYSYVTPMPMAYNAYTSLVAWRDAAGAHC